jgi:hypothetical protein
MAFQVITKKRGEVVPTVFHSNATLNAAFDAQVMVALNDPTNVFVAIRNDAGTTLGGDTRRYLPLRDVPSPSP